MLAAKEKPALVAANTGFIPYQQRQRLAYHFQQSTSCQKINRSSRS